MTHLPPLITDLGLILGSAGLITLLFKWLKQPLVLGYIIAGFLVGPNVHVFPNVVERDSINTWAEIGIIFLLFGLGLEFSFKKLIKVGGTAAITALIGVSSTISAGYLIGQALGWSFMDALFLGGILGISSTAIIIRALAELNLKSRRFASVVTGVLVIEDLVAVVLLVLLSTVAVSRSFSGGVMLASVLKLGFFLMLWFLAGIFLIPTFLNRSRRLMNDETLLVVSLALCFGMVFLASEAGFSAALGAFIMGSILAETFQGVHIEHMLKPVRDLFAAIFFVSVGMLLDPTMLKEHMVPILLGMAVLLIVKPFFATMGALISGQPLKTAMRAGMTLSQIGEFSFIIASLGLSLKVTSAFLYPIAVAISVATAFTTPYMIRLSEPTVRWFESTLPENIRKRLNSYSSGAQTVVAISDWKRLLRAYLLNGLIYSVLLVGTVVLVLRYIQPRFKSYEWGPELTVLLGLLAMAPFLWALALRRSQRETFEKFWMQKKFKGPLAMMEALRLALALLIVGFLVTEVLSIRYALQLGLVTLFILFIFTKKIQGFYDRIESRFIANLNQKEEEERSKTAPELAPWDAHISLFEVNADSTGLGTSLLDLRLREQFGVNIAMIERGNRMIMTPSRYERIYPGDLLSVIGTDDQLERFGQFLAPKVAEPQVTKLQQRQEVALRRLSVKTNSPLLHKTIRESGIRERSNGIIVGIERNGFRMLNPDSSERFEEGDTIWIVGNILRLQVLMKDE